MSLLKLIGLVIHVWSIIVTYVWFGFLSALAAAFLPLISQIFLAIFLAVKVGIFNPYTMVIIIFATVFIATSFLKTAMMNKIVEADPLRELRRLRF
jgi:hypothetical protein